MKKQIAATALATLLLSACASNFTSGNPAADEVALVRDAERVAERMGNDADFAALDRALDGAVGAIVFPDVVKGGFIFGAEGGNGVMMARRGGTWSDPTFVTVGAGSVGLQIGGQVQDVVMVFRNQGAMEAVLNNGLKLGGEASVAAGPAGVGVEGNTTTNLDADVIVFADSAGAFAGVALEGAVIAPRDDRNEDFYGANVTSRDILFRKAPTSSTAAGLRAALNS